MIGGRVKVECNIQVYVFTDLCKDQNGMKVCWCACLHVYPLKQWTTTLQGKNSMLPKQAPAASWVMFLVCCCIVCIHIALKYPGIFALIACFYFLLQKRILQPFYHSSSPEHIKQCAQLSSLFMHILLTKNWTVLEKIVVL